MAGYYYFIRNNVTTDIHSIFESGQPSSPTLTGFHTAYGDLNSTYNPIGGTSSLVYPYATNLYSSIQNKDLNQIFALNFIDKTSIASNLYFTQAIVGSTTATSGIRIFITGDSTMRFNYPVKKTQVWTIGGGGGGGNGGDYGNGKGCGGGGGGGFGHTTITVTDSYYNITSIGTTIGSGGAPNPTRNADPADSQKTTSILYSGPLEVFYLYAYGGCPGGTNGAEGTFRANPIDKGGSGSGASSSAQGQNGGYCGSPTGDGGGGLGQSFTVPIFVAQGDGGSGQANGSSDGAGGGGGGVNESGQNATVNGAMCGGDGGKGKKLYTDSSGTDHYIGGGGGGGIGYNSNASGGSGGDGGGGHGANNYLGSNGQNAQISGGGGFGAGGGGASNAGTFVGGWGSPGVTVLVILNQDISI
jgi:hypothetical protein